jgi:hypothetical protein
MQLNSNANGNNLLWSLPTANPVPDPDALANISTFNGRLQTSLEPLSSARSAKMPLSKSFPCHSYALPVA